MDLSRLQLLNDYLFIAIGVALFYFVAGWLAAFLTRLMHRFRAHRSGGHRPGEMVHQALKVTGRMWDQYRTAALLFSVSLILLINFGRFEIFAQRSDLINVLLALCLLAPLVLLTLKCIQLVRYRMRLGDLLEIHDQMAQRLVEVQVRGNRVFPSVRSKNILIDNVVVGANGVYALQLFTAPPDGETVSYSQGALIFQPGGHRISVRPFMRHVKELATVLSREINNTVEAVPVLVVPDCKVEGQEESGPILVSLQACNSFIGFRQEFFLHNEDIARVSAWVDQQRLEDPPKTLNSAVEALQRQIDWPALVGS